MLRRQELRDVRAMPIDELAEPEHDLGAFRERRFAPRGQRIRSNLDGAVDLLNAREVDLVRLDAGGGIEHGPASPGLAQHDLPTDVMTDPFHVSTPAAR